MSSAALAYGCSTLGGAVMVITDIIAIAVGALRLRRSPSSASAILTVIGGASVPKESLSINSLTGSYQFW